MLIIKSLGVYEHIEKIEYKPTTQEMHYWYSGTHSGVDPYNPYAPRYGVSVKKVIKKLKKAQS